MREVEGPGWVMHRGMKRRASEAEAVRAILLLEAIGMPWVARRAGPETWFGWNGKALRLNEPITDILHEMAHWIVATPAERTREDFGDPEGALLHDGSRWPSVEEAVSLLGILVERAMGLSWADTLTEHNWREQKHSFFRTLTALRSLGLVDDMTPTLPRSTRRMLAP